MPIVITSAASIRFSGADYRPDIDGLRAVAVLAVVLNHAAPSLLPGGFLGVDIFFVISGYLISKIIFRELEEGRFRFSHFYARRIRRIFPALILVLLTVLIFGALALFADEYAQLNHHAYWSAAFLENFRLIDETGYFDVAARAKPLMHLWSLSIEEQFYLLWPLLLVLAWRVGRQKSALAILFLLSVLYTFHMGNMSMQETLYFQPIARAWELMLGATLAYKHINSIRGRGDAIAIPVWWSAFSLVGLIAILCGLYPHPWGIPYPGLMTLIPVTGTLLILVCPPSSPGNRLLASKPLVWIGLISYPLYLWHWPIFSFLHIMESGTPAPRFLWLGALLAFVLAALTWRFVELPIRRTTSRNHPRGKFVLGGLCVSMVMLFAVSYGIVRLDLLRLNDYEVDLKWPTKQDATCLQKFPVGRIPEFCRFRDTGGPVVALIGNSHAAVLFPGVSKFASQSGYGTITMGTGGCIGLDGVTAGKNPYKKEECAKFTDTILDVLEQTPNVSHVLLALRGPSHITGMGFGPAEPGANWEDSMISARDDDRRETPERLFQRGLENTFLRLKTHGIRVGYLLQVPELGIPAQNCLPRPLTLTPQKGCKVPYAVYQERMRRYRELVFEVKARHEDMIVIDPEPLFCNQVECNGFIDGKLLYMDDDHLSMSGSFHVAPLILEALRVTDSKSGTP